MSWNYMSLLDQKDSSPQDLSKMTLVETKAKNGNSMFRLVLERRPRKSCCNPSLTGGWVNTLTQKQVTRTIDLKSEVNTAKQCTVWLCLHYTEQCRKPSSNSERSEKNLAESKSTCSTGTSIVCPQFIELGRAESTRFLQKEIDLY